MSGDDLFAPIFTSDELSDATGDRAWLQALLDAEAALARSEADCGIIPAAAAEIIAGACRAEDFDPLSLGRAGRQGGNPVIPLVAALRARLPPPARSWVHWGATSQDILDSAAMLVAERASTLIDADLTRLGAACAGLARSHRDTLMAGRTLLQQALPITFGLKAASWLTGVQAAHDEPGAPGQAWPPSWAGPPAPWRRSAVRALPWLPRSPASSDSRNLCCPGMALASEWPCSAARSGSWRAPPPRSPAT